MAIHNVLGVGNAYRWIHVSRSMVELCLPFIGILPFLLLALSICAVVMLVC